MSGYGRTARAAATPKVTRLHDETSDSAQLGLDLGDKREAARAWPDPDEIRVDVHAILASARAVTAGNMWDRRTYRYNKVFFPELAEWLPDEERDQLCFEFFRELERIELLMAA